MDEALRRLSMLARVATMPAGRVDVGDVVAACRIVQDALGASDAYVICAGDPHFLRLDSEVDPRAYEVKQRGYWLVWRGLAANPEVPATAFNVDDRIVKESSVLAPGVPASHLAAILPGNESNSEMLIVRGPWPHGLGAEQLALLEIARPLVAQLVHSVLDAERYARQRQQLSLLADVANAFNEDADPRQLLTDVATALAKASGFDWVTIALLDDALENIVEYAGNIARYSRTETAQQQFSGSPANAARTVAIARHIAATERPLLEPDVASPESELPVPDEMRRYYERAHIISAGVFPIKVQDRVRGTVAFASSSRRPFDPGEVELLTALAMQASSAINGLRLTRELRQANSELVEANQRLQLMRHEAEYRAMHDALTGLPNRSLFLSRLEATLRRGTACVGILFADLDDFKALNDTLGHVAGDEALRVIAGRLQHTLPPGATAARLGGDEFAVLIEEATDVEDLEQMAATLQDIVSAPFEVDGTGVSLHTSMGIVAGTPDQGPQEMLRRADIAMYAAKALGGGTYRSYEISLDERRGGSRAA